MKMNHKIQVYEVLSQLIQRQQTGTANECARKIGVSRATLFNMLDELRGAGIAIEYDNCVNSYIYTNNKRLRVNTPLEVVEE